MKKRIICLLFVICLILGSCSGSTDVASKTQKSQKTTEKTTKAKTTTAKSSTTKAKTSKYRATTAKASTTKARVSATTEATTTVPVTETLPVEDENPFNNPGKWTLQTLTDYAHVGEEWIYLGNNETVTITIQSSCPNLDPDDFIIIYDEDLLDYDVSFYNPDAQGKTVIKYRMWHIAAGHSEVLILSGYEYVEKGDDCSCYSLDVLGLNSTDGQVVYYTPSGEKYHFSADCAGGNASPTTLYDALAAGYEPCGKCAK